MAINLKYFKNVSASFKDALKDVAAQQLPAIKEFKEANQALISKSNNLSIKSIKNLYKDMKKKLSEC